MKNLFGKLKAEGYATYHSDFGGYKWKVLKTYQRVDKEFSNKHSRWFVSATSNLMYKGTWEMGDTYIRDIIINSSSVTDATPEWLEAYSGYHKIYKVTACEIYSHA